MTQPQELLRDLAHQGEPRGAMAVLAAAREAAMTPVAVAEVNRRGLRRRSVAAAAIVAVVALTGAAVWFSTGRDGSSVHSGAPEDEADRNESVSAPPSFLAVGAEGIELRTTAGAAVERTILRSGSLLPTLSASTDGAILASRAASTCAAEMIRVSPDGTTEVLGIARAMAQRPTSDLITLIGPIDATSGCDGAEGLSYVEPGAGTTAVDLGMSEVAYGQPSWSPDGIHSAVLVHGNEPSTTDGPTPSMRLIIERPETAGDIVDPVAVGELIAPAGERWLSSAFAGNDAIIIARATTDGATELIRTDLADLGAFQPLGLVSGEVTWMSADASGQHLLLVVAPTGGGDGTLYHWTDGSAEHLAEGVRAAIWHGG